MGYMDISCTNTDHVLTRERGKGVESVLLKAYFVLWNGVRDVDESASMGSCSKGEGFTGKGVKNIVYGAGKLDLESAVVQSLFVVKDKSFSERLFAYRFELGWP